MITVISTNISEKKGVVKKPVDEVFLKKDHGIVGDAHAGNWHRQISLLGEESVEKMRKIIPSLADGAFAENINTKGLILFELPIGTRLMIGKTAIVEVTQIGKECHSDCAIKKTVGDCVMPREGIFVKVIEEGIVKSGDEIKIM